MKTVTMKLTRAATRLAGAPEAPRVALLTGLAWACAVGVAMAGWASASAADSAGFAGVWRTARELPGIGSLNKGNSALLALSCASPGNCGAGGYYSLSGGRREAFVADERNGSWRPPLEVPGIGALNKAGDARVLSLSCWSPGNCAAGGTYLEASNRYQAFVVTEKNGRWGRSMIAPATRTLNKGGDAQVESVSCARAGDCAAGGFYRDGANHSQAFVLDAVNGSWRAAKLVPGLATLNKGNFAQLSSVSCAARGDCSAGGFYVDGSSQFHGFVLTESNSTWGTARQVPGLDALNIGGFAKVTVVSCASAGNCDAGGFYHMGPSQVQAFIVTQRNGTWRTAGQVPGTSTLNAGDDAFITSLSCASAGNCSAVGSYTDGVGHIWPFVVRQKNGQWKSAVPAPGVASLSGLGGFGQINSLSCASAGNCAGAGQYNDSTSHSQAFVIVQRNGAWSAAIKVPGLSALNKGDNADATVVSCHAPAGCTAGGYYYDGTGRQEPFFIATR